MSECIQSVPFSLSRKALDSPRKKDISICCSSRKKEVCCFSNTNVKMFFSLPEMWNALGIYGNIKIIELLSCSNPDSSHVKFCSWTHFIMLHSNLHWNWLPHIQFLLRQIHLIRNSYYGSIANSLLTTVHWKSIGHWYYCT